MKKIYELKNQRAGILKEAENALTAQNMDVYNAKMEEVKNLNAQIEALEAFEAENSKYTPEVVAAKTAATDQEVGVIDRAGPDYLKAFLYAITNGYTVKNGVGNERLAPLYNALTSGGGNPVGSDGGFLVPVEFNDMINEQRRQLVALAELFNVEHVTAPTGWRAVDAVPTSGFTLVDEMATIPKDDQPKFSKVIYALKKYALIVPVSSELMSDNTAGLMAYLSRWFAKKSVITENALLKTLLSALTPANLTAGDEVESLKSSITKDLDPSISLSASIITNQSSFAFLDSVKDATGRSLMQPDPTTGTPMLFKNKKVVMLSDAHLPNRKVTTSGDKKGDYYPIFVGDYKTFGTLFRKNPFEVSTTNIGGNAWATDSSEVRGIVRLDAQKMDPEAAIYREIFIPAQ